MRVPWCAHTQNHSSHEGSNYDARTKGPDDDGSDLDARTMRAKNFAEGLKQLEASRFERYVVLYKNENRTTIA